MYFSKPSSLFITAAFLMLTINIYSQPPDTLWTKTFGGSNIDIGHSVQETSDGGYIITGYTRSFGSMSGRNLFLLKTDLFGKEEWINTFGGNDDDEGHSVKQTFDGGYIASGLTKSPSAGGNDVFLVKTDSSGDHQWSKNFGGTNDDEGYSVIQTPDSGFVVAGVTSSFAMGGRDVWLIKTDKNGNQLWTETFGGFGSDGAWEIEQTNDNGFILTGWTFSEGPGFLGNVFLVKTDSAGNEEWNNYFGGDGADRGYSVKQTSDSGYVIAGYTSSFGAGLDDMLLIKTNSNGDSLWSQTFGGSGRDYANSVDVTTDGGFIITGYTLSFGSGGDDLWLVRTDSEGNELWNKTFGGGSSDVGYEVAQTSDGGYIITGHILSYGAGLHDIWLIKTEPKTTNIKDDLTLPEEFILHQNYPNPFNPATKIRYEIPAVGTRDRVSVQIKVYDVLGNEIATLVDEYKSAGAYEVEFPCHSCESRNLPAGRQNLPSGVYFYRLQIADYVETKKMILLR